MNELKLLSQRMDIDIWEAIESAAAKPFGFMPFYRDRDSPGALTP